VTLSQFFWLPSKLHFVAIYDNEYAPAMKEHKIRKNPVKMHTSVTNSYCILVLEKTICGNTVPVIEMTEGRARSVMNGFPRSLHPPARSDLFEALIAL
jgi:hypothetical protein